MCGRYTNTLSPHQLAARLDMPIEETLAAAATGRYNIAPSQQVLAIVAPEGHPEARLLRWGLVPAWADSLTIGYKMINARMETASSRPAYRGLIGRADRRALQIADGYIEWLKTEQPGRPRQPFLFQVDGGEPFTFAALWTIAHIDGQPVESITMLTCPAAPNRIAAAIHNRMPVILPDRASRQAWLDPSLDGPAALALCGTLPEARLSARPISPQINRAGGPEDPSLLRPPDDTQPQTLPGLDI